MSWLRLILRSLAYYRSTGAVVAFGMAIATTVVTGALVTGDSVRGSLRDTGLARLGRIDYALVAPSYFRESLAADLLDQPDVAPVVQRIAPLVLSQGAARDPETEAVAPGIALFGVDPGFWELQDMPRKPELAGRACAINEALAGDLGLRAGDPLLVTVHHHQPIASDTLFARRGRQDVAPSLRLQVESVLPAGGVGDFRLDTQSSTPRNLFLSRQWLAERLDLAGRANVLVAACVPAQRGRAGEALKAGLAASCTVQDHGLAVVPNRQQGYLSLISGAMLLTPGQVEAAKTAASDCGGTPAVTSVYLATRIARADRAGPGELAYAVIAGLEPLTPLPSSNGKRTPSDGGIWLNTWAARDLGCRVGESLDVSYLVPTEDGTYPVARTTLRLEATVELAGPAADPGLTPDFEGMTDAEHVRDWDPPFPIDLDRVTQRDEDYWEQHRATPKAFASLATVRAMWRSGPAGKDADWVTSLRVAPPPGADLTAFDSAFKAALNDRLAPEASGLAFAPIRKLTLEAFRGTSDFGQLFLGLSMFLVISGAGLAAMLLRLAVDRRASDAGIMLACGCDAGRVSRALFAEGALLTTLGVLVGVPTGVLYARGMIGALGCWWQGALGSTPALWLHVAPFSLAVGGISGLGVGLVVAGLGVRRLRRRRVLDLLGGWQAMAVMPESGRAWPAMVALWTSLVAAAVLGALALLTGSVPAQVAFFGIGAALLVAGLAAATLALRTLLRRGGASRSLARLSLRNAAAAGGRSLLTIGLLASATFTVVATATNARDFSGIDVTDKQSGTGGFALQAISSVPLSFDLGTSAGRANLGFTPEDEAALEGVEVMSFLASRGEDVSCLNLARPSSPRVLGVPPAMTDRGGFSVMHEGASEGASPWALLEQTDPNGAVPAFGDAASVKWTLHSGLGEIYTIPAGNLQFVGLLPGSIFARELLVSEASFRRLFPAVTAPSYFLIATPPGREGAVTEVLRRNLGDLGLQVRTTRRVLNEFIRVQNTYLSMFLALGGLGLLLGTVGLGATLVRSALERRRELALMTAVGYTRPTVGRVLLMENGGLLVTGLLWGTVSALVAVAPHLVSAGSQVNWAALVGVLAAVLVVGLATCVVAVRAVLRAELVPALRRE